MWINASCSASTDDIAPSVLMPQPASLARAETAREKESIDSRRGKSNTCLQTGMIYRCKAEADVISTRLARLQGLVKPSNLSILRFLHLFL